MNNLIDYFDEGQKVDEKNTENVVNVDFKKVFDKVPHEGFANKTGARGRGGSMLAGK